jgi:hypothetical protein
VDDADVEDKMDIDNDNDDNFKTAKQPAPAATAAGEAATNAVPDDVLLLLLSSL